MENDKIRFQLQDGIAVITMDHQKNLNAVDEPMIDALMEKLDECDQDEKVRVIVLRGEGKAFSAGGDISYFKKQIQESGRVTLDTMITKSGQLIGKMKRLKKMIIGCVNGPAAGAGAVLAYACDFTFCSDRSKFLHSFVNLGLVPDFGGVYLMSRIIGINETLRLCALGEGLFAAEAEKLGLVYKVTSAEALEEEVQAFAKRLAAGPTIAYENLKKQLYEANFTGYEAFLRECEVPTEISCTDSEDFQEAVKAFIAKQPIVFRGK